MKQIIVLLLVLMTSLLVVVTLATVNPADVITQIQNTIKEPHSWEKKDTYDGNIIAENSVTGNQVQIQDAVMTTPHGWEVREYVYLNSNDMNSNAEKMKAQNTIKVAEVINEAGYKLCIFRNLEIGNSVWGTFELPSNLPEHSSEQFSNSYPPTYQVDDNPVEDLAETRHNDELWRKHFNINSNDYEIEWNWVKFRIWWGEDIQDLKHNYLSKIMTGKKIVFRYLVPHETNRGEYDYEHREVVFDGASAAKAIAEATNIDLSTLLD